MAHYSIKELEHLSGIKAHTIRIWEQRYGLLTPNRTETNIRYYSDADLKLILNVSLLHDKGFKISKIAAMSAEELKAAVMAQVENANGHQGQINVLILAMMELDEEKLDQTLSLAIQQLGFEAAMLEVIYPFLNRIGILWQTDKINPAQEHFVSNLIRQKLIVAIDGQSSYKKEGNKFILFLPEGELHELTLLFLNFILRARRHQVLYLSQNLPLTDLISAQDQFGADFLVTSLTSSPDWDEVQQYINTLSHTFPDCQIFMNGYQTQQEALEFPDNVRKITLIPDFIGFIEALPSLG